MHVGQHSCNNNCNNMDMASEPKQNYMEHWWHKWVEQHLMQAW